MTVECLGEFEPNGRPDRPPVGDDEDTFRIAVLSVAAGEVTVIQEGGMISRGHG